MAKESPVGLGAWIAFPSILGGYKKAIPILKSCGISWVAPRCGNGASQDKSFSEQDAQDLIDAGLKVYPWVFSKPAEYKGSVQIYKKVVGWGCHGIIDDAEIPWEKGDHRAEALQYMKMLRGELGDIFIADAPWPWILYHPGFPAAEFATGVDARMPQLYWTEINDSGFGLANSEMVKQWGIWNKKNPSSIKPIWPIGLSYGRDELKSWGVSQLPPGKFRDADLEGFLTTYKDLPASIYTMEAAAKSAVLLLQKTEIERAPTVPPVLIAETLAPANPIGAGDRAEWEAAETERNERIVNNDDATILSFFEDQLKSRAEGFNY